RAFQDRQDDPEAGRREDDRDEQGRLHKVTGAEAVSDSEGERERNGVAESGEPQDTPPQPIEVDLETGEQEEKRESDQSENLHRLVVRRPAENLGPDDDPEQDLEDDRGQANAGEADNERCDNRDDRDDRDGRERDHRPTASVRSSSS